MAKVRDVRPILGPQFSEKCSRPKGAGKPYVLSDGVGLEGRGDVLKKICGKAQVLYLFVYSPRFAWGGRPHRRFISVRERGFQLGLPKLSNFHFSPP